MKKNTWKYKPKQGEQYFFLHVPKTAGTTFRKLLSNHFDQQDIYPSPLHLLVNKNKYLRQPTLIENRQDLLEKPLIMGHYNVRLLPHLSPEVKTLIFFRKPMDRISSHIKHLIAKDKAYAHGDPNLVIEDKFEQLTNLQARFLGYTKKKPNLPQVLENLDKMTFIGIHEYFAESVEKCNKQFGWQLDYQSEKENVSKNNFITNITEENKARLQIRIQPEQQVYERALEIFGRRN